MSNIYMVTQKGLFIYNFRVNIWIKHINLIAISEVNGNVNPCDNVTVKSQGTKMRRRRLWEKMEVGAGIPPTESASEPQYLQFQK